MSLPEEDDFVTEIMAIDDDTTVEFAEDGLIPDLPPAIRAMDDGALDELLGNLNEIAEQAAALIVQDRVDPREFTRAVRLKIINLLRREKLPWDEIADKLWMNRDSARESFRDLEKRPPDLSPTQGDGPLRKIRKAFTRLGQQVDERSLEAEVFGFGLDRATFRRHLRLGVESGIFRKEGTGRGALYADTGETINRDFHDTRLERVRIVERAHPIVKARNWDVVFDTTWKLSEGGVAHVTDSLHHSRGAVRMCLAKVLGGLDRESRKRTRVDYDPNFGCAVLFGAAGPESETLDARAFGLSVQKWMLDQRRAVLPAKFRLDRVGREEVRSTVLRDIVPVLEQVGDRAQQIEGSRSEFRIVLTLSAIRARRAQKGGENL